MPQELENFKSVVNRYEHKAEILRQSHSDLYTKYKNRSDIVTIITITLSALITFLALTDPAKILSPLYLGNYIIIVSAVFPILLALIGFIVLTSTLLNFVLNWQDNCIKHEAGVRLLTGYITSIKDMKDSVNDVSFSEEEIKNKIKDINEKYLLICEILPLVPDQDFLKSKQKYMLKREISAKLDEDPRIITDLDKYYRLCKKKMD